MNRLVLIGNGFDLAHGLKTSYADFINWYWERRMFGFNNDYSDVSEDLLCRFRILNDKREERETWSTLAFAHNYFRSIPALGKKYIGKDIIASIIEDKEYFETKFSPFFEQIIKSIETKGWVDIEDEYYMLLTQYAFPISSDKEPDTKLIAGLNEQLHYLQELLVTYLKEITVEKPEKIQSIKDAMYAPFINDDFSIEGTKALKEHKSYWENHEERDKELISIVEKFGLDTIQCKGDVRCWREDQPNGSTIYPPEFLLPKNIMVLNFNYTHTAQIYCNRFDSFEEVHIHGDIENGDSIIFGYGDEFHADFAKLKEQGNDECLRNVKSIRYMEAPNYRQMLSFIESEPFQVLILGHSCGLSDRTLLNTIFEHPNCVSIKPYYYITDKEKGTDNYIELVQHISRNFNDMKLMRDRVVNKTQCEPLVKE